MAVAVPPDAAGSVPPQNDEAETSVLGAILLTEQALDGVLIEVGLRPEDFYRPRHQLIFGSMIRLKEKAEPEAVDALTVCDDLRRAGELEEAGGEAYVHSLPTLVPAVGAVCDYARIVRDHALLRACSTPRARSRTRSHLPRRAARADRAGRGRDLPDRPRRRHEPSCASIEDVLHEELDKLEELSRKDVGLTGTPSGFNGPRRPHRRLPARQPDRAGRPARDGQVRARHNIAENAADRPRQPVALFSLEMSETELAQRFIASQAKVSSDELRKGRVKADRWPKVLKATEKLASAPLYVDDSSDLGVLELRAKARRLHARHGARAADRGLPAADAAGGPARQPRRAGRQDQPRAQDPGARARRSR